MFLMSGPTTVKSKIFIQLDMRWHHIQCRKLLEIIRTDNKLDIAQILNLNDLKSKWKIYTFFWFNNLHYFENDVHKFFQYLL